MNGFTFGAGRFRDQPHFGRNILFDVQLRQGDRQPNAVAKRGDGLNFFNRRVLQYQLCQRAERDLFTMVKMMRIRHRRHAVVNGMRRRQPAAFKAHPAEIGVGFDNAFQRRCDDMLLCRQHRFLALFNQRVVAQLCQR